MPSTVFRSRQCPQAVAALALWLGATVAAGTEPTSAPPRTRAASAAVPAVAAPEPGSLDALREKLARKLGAPRAVDPVNPAEVKLAARTSGEFQVAAGSRAAAPKPARRADRDAAPDTGHAGHGHWSYQGATGPEAWGRLSPDFAACAKGQRQSPIDIRDGIAVELEPIAFDYRPGAFAVVDNGHTVQVNVAPGSAIEVLGRRYVLQQFHFHRPGEERIDGRTFEMSLHLVHRDPEGRLAVVALLLERGVAQPEVQTVWNNLPLEKGEELAARVTLDPGALLPTDRGYYTYMGSLTTPPCSEGVLWMVMRQPVSVAPAQIDLFARLYPMNARPVQAAAGRRIKQSN